MAAGKLQRVLREVTYANAPDADLLQRFAQTGCDLEGKSRKEVARSLGCAEGTVGSRLARGRELLRARLCHHGFGLSVGALAVVWSETRAAVPPSLVSAAVKAVTVSSAKVTALA